MTTAYIIGGVLVSLPALMLVAVPVVVGWWRSVNGPQVYCGEGMKS